MCTIVFRLLKYLSLFNFVDVIQDVPGLNSQTLNINDFRTSKQIKFSSGSMLANASFIRDIDF